MEVDPLYKSYDSKVSNESDEPEEPEEPMEEPYPESKLNVRFVVHSQWSIPYKIFINGYF